MFSEGLATRPSLLALEHGLNKFGLPAALGYLNKWVPHRFTTIYELRGDTFHATHVVDKEKQVSPADVSPFKLSRSFCEIVLNNGTFMTLDSAVDPMAVGTAYRGIVRSYVGLPLSTDSARVYGTLCHHDFVEQQQITDEQFAFLRQAASVMSSYL